MSENLLVQSRTGTEEIRDSLRVYGGDVAKTKFPSYVDGLKDVTRRIVWVSRSMKEFVSFAKMQADTFDIHTTGESSIYRAIVRLAQPFMVGTNTALIDIGGKAGEYYDPSASAAPRYLTAAISEYARDIFYNGINLKTIPMTAQKEFNGMEPKYFIPKIPTALILGNLTVGFGFKSYTPMLPINAVCDLVSLYSKHFQKGGTGCPPAKDLAKYLVPCFPINNLIKNKAELMQAYARGEYDAPIKLDGAVDISGNSITLRAVPYGTDFGSVVQTLRSQLKNPKHPLYDYLVTVNQYSADEAEVNIELRRGQNPFEVLDKLRATLRYSNVLHPIFTYTKNEQIMSVPPPNLIYMWYKERAASISGGLKYKQEELILKRLTLEAMLVVAEQSDAVIEIIKASDGEEDATAALYERFPTLSLSQAKIVATQRLLTLAKSSKRQIEADLEATKAEIESTNASFSRIDQRIGEEAQYIKKKYGSKDSLTRYSEEFAGYVQFGNWGISHFYDEDGLYDLLNSKGWPGSIRKYIHWYNPKEPIQSLIVDGKVIPAVHLSKDIACEDVICGSNRSTHTLVIGHDQSTSVIERAVTGSYGDFKLIPVTSKFHAIRRNGSVTEETVDSFSTRKTVSRGAKTDIIHAVPSYKSDMVVFHMNTTDVNTLRADRILHPGGLGRVASVPTGNMILLGVVSINAKDVYLNIPDECKKNIAVEYLKIGTVADLFSGKKNSTMISLGKSADFNKRFKRNPSVRTMFSMVGGA